MASIEVRADTIQVDRISGILADYMNQRDWITARAMTDGVKAGKVKIQQKIFPMIQGGPNAWTRRGLIATFATRTKLKAQVGFNYGGGEYEETFFSRKKGGVPSGRYMSVNATGGSRLPKSTELQFRKKGLVSAKAFLVPNSNDRFIDKHGNLPGPIWQQIASRLRASDAIGSTQNAPYGPGSRGRTARKRKAVDYFIKTSGRRRGTGQPIYVARRAGKGGRGFEPVLWIKQDVRYRKRFPIQSVVMKEFQRVFVDSFERELAISINKRRKY
ncbi:MAG: hypothetical protein VKO39_12810 [Cyanobacteriota bacterium]|nr:hypothetical protein [Cyanobacteriota bacterium]